MIIVKLEMKRCEAGYTYSLLRVLETKEELEKMQLEYPFPLQVLTDSIKEFPEEKFRDVRVEGAPGWYYYRPRMGTELFLNS